MINLDDFREEYSEAIDAANEFAQAEIDLRQSNGFTRNLAWQYRVNNHFDRECVDD